VKCEKLLRAISVFQLPGLQRTQDLSLPLHFKTPKREMRKSPRSHFGISATGTSKDTSSLFMFSVSATLHGKNKLINIEQVVETSTQAMNARYGGSGG
jgi:hypothetical protein